MFFYWKSTTIPICTYNAWFKDFLLQSDLTQIDLQIKLQITNLKFSLNGAQTWDRVEARLTCFENWYLVWYYYQIYIMNNPIVLLFTQWSVKNSQYNGIIIISSKTLYTYKSTFHTLNLQILKFTNNSGFKVENRHWNK